MNLSVESHIKCITSRSWNAGECALGCGGAGCSSALTKREPWIVEACDTRQQLIKPVEVIGSRCLAFAD